MKEQNTLKPQFQDNSFAPYSDDLTMKALVLKGPKQFEIEQIPIPVPAPGEALCRVRAVAICGTDPKIIRGELPGLWPPYYPFVIGHEWAGEIVGLGEGMNDFSIGDRVVGEPHKGCGYCYQCMKGHYNLCQNYAKSESGHRHYGFTAQGCYAEYLACSVKVLHKIPGRLSFAEGAMVDSAAVALHGLRLANVEPGCTAAVIGPGPIGLCAVQLVRAMGASQVLVLGRAGPRLEMARELGANRLIDVLDSDPSGKVLEMTNDKGVDITIDASGASEAPTFATKMTRFGGKIVLLGFFSPSDFNVPLGDVVFKEQTIYGVRANPNIDDQVIKMMETGQLCVDRLISHRFSLDHFAEAFDTFVNRKDGAMKVIVEP